MLTYSLLANNIYGGNMGKEELGPAVITDKEERILRSILQVGKNIDRIDKETYGGSMSETSDQTETLIVSLMSRHLLTYGQKDTFLTTDAGVEALAACRKPAA